MRKSKLLVFFSTLIIFSCSSGKETANSRLHDIWAIESIEGEKININENFKNLPVLEIYLEEERFHGNTSCNTINGKINVDETKLKFYDVVTTEMACPGNLEKRFLTNLIKVNRYKIEKMKLYLYEDDNELMIFQKID